jgi:hypothetical protein
MIGANRPIEGMARDHSVHVEPNAAWVGQLLSTLLPRTASVQKFNPSISIHRANHSTCVRVSWIRSRQVPLIDIAAFVPHGELAKHQAGKPVEIRRGRATVIDPNFSSTVESQTSFVITIARTGRAIPGG